MLTQKLVFAIEPAVDLRYNLSWAFGGFFDLLPKRLGNNEALDACVSALVSAHADFCTNQGQLTTHALSKHSLALNILRDHLDDPVKARAADTLCAVMVLLMGQIVEGLFNPKIQFSAKEWEILADNDLDPQTLEGRLMRCLGRVPIMLLRARTIHRGEQRHLELIQEARAQHHIMSNLTTEIRKLMDTSEQRIPSGSKYKMSLFHIHAHYQRLYGLAITFAILLNRLVRSFDKDDACLSEEMERLSKEAIDLAEKAACYRPLGASWVSLCLRTAQVATENHELKTELDKAMTDYARDFPRMDMVSPASHLESLFSNKHLGDSKSTVTWSSDISQQILLS
ncbi:MAG: hypothetical protein Q9160_008246 [Pyrenula sp. 1 TL-2023]